MENQLEGVDGFMRPERLARIIGHSPKYVRDDIASLVEGEQIPGSFGDLIRRSVEMTVAHKEFEGTNIVSILGKCAVR
ncbi:MAG: hypothetical protein C0406_06780 [Sideroxydans sp.]|nr:hypothetical protein [Sideroxydans sp.]